MIETPFVNITFYFSLLWIHLSPAVLLLSLLKLSLPGAQWLTASLSHQIACRHTTTITTREGVTITSGRAAASTCSDAQTQSLLGKRKTEQFLRGRQYERAWKTCLQCTEFFAKVDACTSHLTNGQARGTKTHQ